MSAAPIEPRASRDPAPRGRDLPPGQAWDPPQLRALVRVLMRARTSPRMWARRPGKPRGLLFALGMQAMFGLLLGAIVFTRMDSFTFGQYLCAMTLFIGAGTMIAESSQLLFSVEENDLLLHRPIHPRTLLLAKSFTLFALAAAYSLALNLVPMVLGAWARGAAPWFPATHLFTILLLSVFIASLVVFLYSLLTRFVSRERFDGIASWFQVAVSAALIFGYQIVPRLTTPAHGFRINPENPVLWFVPSAWFGALDALLGGMRPTPALLGMAGLSLGTTFLLCTACLGRIASDYARRLGSLAETPVRITKPKAAGQRVRVVRGSGRMHPILRAWMPDPRERAAFGLASTYLRRDRDVRMRVYPGLASFIVFPILPLFDRNMGPSFAPIMTVVMAGMLPTLTLETLRTGTQSVAADVFLYTPLESTASLFHGVRKATIVLVTVPMLVIAFVIIGVAVHEVEPLLAMLPALIVLPTMTLLDGLVGDYLPLSRSPESGRQTAIQVGVSLATIAAMGGLFGIGWVARSMHVFWPVLGVELVVVAGIHALLLRKIRARPLRIE
jgi:hypothetical protein